MEPVTKEGHRGMRENRNSNKELRPKKKNGCRREARGDKYDSEDETYFKSVHSRGPSYDSNTQCARHSQVDLRKVQAVS